MNLPPNLPAKNSVISIQPKLYAHIKPWRPPEEVSEKAIQEAKQRLVSQLNCEEIIARRIMKAKRIRERLEHRLKH